MLKRSTDHNLGPADDMSVIEAMQNINHIDDLRRREAAFALYGREAAVTVLTQRLIVESNVAVRDALVSTLVSIASPEVIDFFIRKIRSDDARRRSEAVMALQQMPEQSATKIRALLSDPDSDVRIMAVDIIRLLPIADAAEWLGTLLQTEKHANVIGAALDRLSEIGRPADVKAIEAVAQRFTSDAFIRFAAEHAARRIKALDAGDPI